MILAVVVVSMSFRYELNCKTRKDDFIDGPVVVYHTGAKFWSGIGHILNTKYIDPNGRKKYRNEEGWQEPL